MFCLMQFIEAIVFPLPRGMDMVHLFFPQCIFENRYLEILYVCKQSQQKQDNTITKQSFQLLDAGFLHNILIHICKQYSMLIRLFIFRKLILVCLIMIKKNCIEILPREHTLIMIDYRGKLESEMIPNNRTLYGKNRTLGGMGGQKSSDIIYG